MLTTTIMDLAIAAGLGLLVGLQKERAESPLAGLRTFALVSLAGAIAAVVGESTTPWVIVGGLLSIAALMVAGNIVLTHAGGDDPGQTTEVAVVVMYLIGVMVVAGSREVAIVLGASTAMLLHLREELHTWVDRLSDRDVRAIMQFVVISLVVLPILPDQTYGPYDVINPRQVWWMVVLIVGLNLAGYAAFRLFGARAGTALAGVLGGVISSTATTISYARQTKTDEDRDSVAVLVVWIASGVVFVRVMLEIGAVAPDFLPTAAGPLSVMLAVFLGLAAVRWRTGAQPGESPLEPGNPSELKPAILFGVLYAVVLLVLAAAEDLLGDTGLYAAAFLSGLTDVDAITLSTSRLVATEGLDPSTGWRIILVGALSNLVFKLGMAATLGSRRFARRLGALVAVALVVGGGILYFWS
ncbi:MAG: MgtC/SapB family protein [Longimicrobiales bacterium]|nr:MgtC/SapB family protein [Longimicrobiales bacterium]